MRVWSCQTQHTCLFLSKEAPLILGIRPLILCLLPRLTGAAPDDLLRGAQTAVGITLFLFFFLKFILGQQVESAGTIHIKI